MFSQTYTDWHLYESDNSSENSVEALLSEYGYSDAYDYVALAHNYGFVLPIIWRFVMPYLMAAMPFLLINNDTVFQPDLIQGLVESSYEQSAKIIAPKKILHYPRRKFDLVWWWLF